MGTLTCKGLLQKKQNDSNGRENICVNAEGRVQSLLSLVFLLKVLTNLATACPLKCEPLGTRPAGITVSDGGCSGEYGQQCIMVFSCTSIPCKNCAIHAQGYCKGVGTFKSPTFVFCSTERDKLLAATLPS